MNIDEILRYLYPNADPLRDWEVWSDKGIARIEVWNLPEPKPNPKELSGVYESEKFRAWRREAQERRIDRETAGTIDKAIHSETPIGEHFAILRDQIAQMLADFGQQPIERFRVLSDIAKVEIANGQKKKEKLSTGGEGEQ